ncbi:MAG: hypothetical protein M0036_07645 [Desulfobacteraceae bacterium]|nr:hypothetical protein [Desulfobacteraceae bacterium]
MQNPKKGPQFHPELAATNYQIIFNLLNLNTIIKQCKKLSLALQYAKQLFYIKIKKVLKFNGARPILKTYGAIGAGKEAILELSARR